MEILIFCCDVTNVLWRFSPDRVRVTLQTSCGAERISIDVLLDRDLLSDNYKLELLYRQTKKIFFSCKQMTREYCSQSFYSASEEHPIYP